MKSSTLTSAGSAGLNPYQWNAFSYQLGLSWGPIRPPDFTPATVEVIADGAYPNFKYRFTPPGAYPFIPAWIKPGVGLLIKASFTIAGKSYDISDAYIVESIDPSGSGGYFEVAAPRPASAGDAVAFTQAAGPVGVDNASGAVPTPTVTLIVQAQQAVITLINGAGTVAPVVCPNGNIPYQLALSDGSPPMVIEAPVGGKFDLADWSVVGTAGAPGTLYVAFI